MTCRRRPFGNAVQMSGDSVRVVNNGTITARTEVEIPYLNTTTNSGIHYALALSSPHGGDVTLSLGRESVTTGDVSMNGGRATLVLDGNPVLNGNISYDTARDFNLVLNNDGRFTHALPVIANLTKNEVGSYRLPTLNAVHGMTLNQGELWLDSGYNFAANGQLQVGIHGDGSHGSLRSSGTVNLDGTLRVVRDDELYADGTRYRLVSANAIGASSAFDSIELPADSALVTFASERDAQHLDVVAHVADFASVAGRGNQGRHRQVAGPRQRRRPPMKCARSWR